MKAAVITLLCNTALVGALKAGSESPTSNQAYIEGQIDLIKAFPYRNPRYLEYLVLDLVKSVLDNPKDFPLDKYPEGGMIGLSLSDVNEFYSFKFGEYGVLSEVLSPGSAEAVAVNAKTIINMISETVKEGAQNLDTVVYSFRERK